MKLKITEGNAIIRHFVPAKRISDNMIGLYDLISELFFINQGRGEFIGITAE